MLKSSKMRALPVAAAGLCAALAVSTLAHGKPKAAKPAPAAPAKPAAAAPAPAATAPVAPMVGFNSAAPIDATADSMEQFRDQHLTIMRGNVEVIQGDVRIRTPELKLFSADKGGAPGAAPAGIGPDSSFGAVDKMEAAGPVYYVTPAQQAKADHASYDKTADTIVMVGNVILTQDKNIVTGDKLVVEQKTGHATVISNTVGLNKPKRVRGVFYPQQAPAPGAVPAPAAAPPPAAAPGPAPAKPPKRAKATSPVPASATKKS